MKLATLMAAVAVVGLSGVAMAADPVPATQAVVTTAGVAGTGKVLVLSFASMSDGAGQYDWIGRGVRENMMTELGRMKALALVTPGQGVIVTDTASAIEAGKAAGADSVVFGTFQMVDQDLRINGEVVDVATGKVVGTLKSTGTVRDLFAMEDTVAQQAKRLLVPAVYKPADLPLAIPAPVVQPAPPPVIEPQRQSFVNDYNRNTYYPSTPYYGYGYGYGYPGYAYGGYGGYGGYGYYGGYYPAVTAGWVGVNRTVTRPIGVGTSAGMVASGMISVQGNILANGQLAR